MKLEIFYISCFLYFLIGNGSAIPQTTETYSNKFVLQQPDLINLFWNYDQQKITFELQVQNRKRWIMFGIKSTTISDVIVAWLNEDSTGHFSDRYIDPVGSLNKDTKQNWILIDAFSKDDYNVFKFSRNIKLCDALNINQDIDIPEGIASIIFSHGTDFINEDIVKSSVNTVSFQLIDKNKGPFSCVPIFKLPVFNSEPTDTYSYYEDLVPGNFRFYWNTTETYIIGEIHCRTSGWVGFGLSPNGGMDKSDVIIGWIKNNGVVNFTDRYISGREVKIDKNQNWNLLYSRESNGFTVFKFNRSIILCDSDDRLIEQGSPYTIFAWGENDPIDGQDISYHLANRGSKVIMWLKGEEKNKSYQQINDEPIEKLSFTISNVILPKRDTYYYCKSFQVPTNLTQKRHIVKWELEMPTMNIPSMHHFLMYECVPDYNGMPALKPGDCFSSDTFHRYCPSSSLGWAIGGLLVNEFPSDQGYPIGGNTDYRYFVLEIHYDNPMLDIGYIENFGIKLYTTTNLRKNELGVLTLGAQSSPDTIAIPPNEDLFKLSTYCYKECTESKLASSSLTVVSAIPHTHLVGTGVSTRIIRNGKDIGYLYRNKYYDFNYQNSYPLNPYIKLLKGDELITECVYNSKSRSNFTFGGIGTRNEMCLQFFTYYPRNNNFKQCLSFPSSQSLLNLFLDLNKTGDVYFDKNFNSNNIEDRYRIIYNVLGTLKQQSPNVKNKYKQFYETTKYNYQCNLDYVFDQLNPIIPSNTFIETSLCNNSSNNNNNNNNINSIINMAQDFFNWLFSWLFK